MGILEFAEDGETICEDDHIRLGSRQIVCDLNCSFFESFGFCLKVGGIFSCGYGATSYVSTSLVCYLLPVAESTET